MRRRVAIVGSVADEMRGERRNRGGTQSSCRLDGGSGGGSRGEEGSCLGQGALNGLTSGEVQKYPMSDRRQPGALC